MGSIPSISPIASLQTNTATAAQTAPVSDSSSAQVRQASLSAAEQPSSTAGVVDSVTLSTHGERVLGTITYAGGEYVASEPGPPQVSVSGDSPTEASNKLIMAVYRLG